ncbi:multiple sugar transport system permease protein [Hydrogenispora ethanolica]|uniref:Multiple sugar transport system permease protein n=1 Tax=Hydrogenispora ethanolica TaxID=1082276 RepID=A0A4R1QV70_HYDET|nr:carbohydrate ABC transporter permease [Hydrogenispora ethanolica]TCL56465.1 multiple sugar transport system permease protein [Hydrogenispora ethanolica]
MNEQSLNRLISIIMLVLSLIILVPFLIMLVTSFKTMGEVLAPNFTFIPKQWAFFNYIEAMTTGNWGRYFFNSFFITAVAVVVSLIINSVAGFAFARLEFKGRDLLFFISLIGLMVPQQVTMIPVFLILKHVPLAGGNDLFGQGGMGWVDSYMGLIIPYIAGSFGVFLFRQFYLNFPKSLDDAARIDGLTSLKTYLYIYLPLSKPVLATLIVLKTTSTWNEYTWPLIITVSDKMKTVQLALTLFRDETNVQWTLMMAATTLIVLPLLIIFLTLQKYFVEGIVTTGIKG